MSDKKKKEDLYYSQNETIAHNDKLLRFNAVSYTHLDVYKRQV